MTKTAPILTFTAPYWALVRKGLLALTDNGETFGVKTRSQPWAHRGPVLFSNSQRSERYVLERYQESTTWLTEPGVIGLGYLAEVRQLTDDEKVQLYRGYNNLWGELTEDDHEVACSRKYTPVPRVRAHDFGYFFRNVTWLDEALSPPRVYGVIGIADITDVLLEHFPQLHTYD